MSPRRRATVARPERPGRRSSRRALARLSAVVLLGAVPLARPVPAQAAAAVQAPLSAQAARFQGWDEMLDPAFRHDPDERSLMGFHVAVPADARAAFDDVERFLDDGDALAAARLLVATMKRHGTHGLQVAEGRDRWESRWVGAGEWALYLLLTRVSPDVRAQVLSAEQRERLQRAVSWRDQSALAALARRYEGLPAAAEALRVLALLLAEEGREGAAQVAARRLPDGGRLAAALPAPEPEPSAPAHLPAGESLTATWPAPGAGWLLPIEQLRRRDGRRRNPFIGASESREAPFAPIDPVVADGVLYVSDSISCWAQELLTGRPLWHHAGPLERVDAELSWSTWFDLGVYISHERPRAISPYQVASPALGEDTLVVALQAAERAYELDRFDQVPINHPLPRRRLVALDRQSGALRWQQERPELGPRAFQNQFDAHGPPVLQGGLVYVAGSVTEGAINAYVAAFDQDDGELVWRTPLCSGQQELTMFNRPFQEHLVSPVLLHEGALYVSTNLGVIGCVDAFSGRLRWLAAYESIERRSSRMVRPMNARPIHWLNQRPFVVDGTLVVAPLDSEWLQGLDVHTGRRRFEIPTATGNTLRAPLRHQALPAGDDRFVVVHDGGLEGFRAADGRPLYAVPFAPYVQPTGAAELAGELLLIPAEPQLLVHELASGRRVDATTLPSTSRDRTVQRVQPAGAALVLVDGAELSAVVDTDEAQRRAAAAPGPASELTLGELALLDRRYDDALLHFARAAADDAPAALASRARSGRTLALLAQAELLDTPAAWERVLEMAGGVADRRRHAQQVLSALARLGDERALVAWLGRLAEESPDLRLSLDLDGSQPVQLLYARRRLPLLAPAEALLVLQDLIELAPEARWDGLPMAESARRRIAALIDEHGAALYAPVEARAEAAARDGADPETLALRFPNAALVAAQRRQRFDALLAAGRADQVLAECALPELRLEAARQLGESAYVALLEGRPTAAVDVLPSLPRDPRGMQRLTLDSQHPIRFRAVTGQPGPGHEGVALGCLQGEGSLFLFDTRAGRLRWSGRALPGGRTSVSHSVDFHMQGGVLVARGRDVVEGLALEDGRLLWSFSADGDILEFVPVGGLVVTLRQRFDELSVVGTGVVSGVEVFRIPLPGAEDARLRQVGDELVCLTTGEYDTSDSRRDKQLLVFDLARGAVRSSLPVDDGYTFLNVCDAPPVVVLMRREDRGSRLLAYDPRHSTVLWEQALPDSRPALKQFVPTGAGRFVLRRPTILPGRDTRRMDWDLLQPFDARGGALPVPADTPILRVVDPPSGLSPWLVLIDPDDLRRLTVLSGPDLARRYELGFDGPLSSSTEVLQAGDGVVLVPDRDDDGVVTVWVVRGGLPGERYSVALDLAGSRQSPQVQLVDGAVVLGIDGDLVILRSEPR